MSAARRPRKLDRVVGVILAGGASSRMGTPKHTLPTPDGRTFGETIRDVLLEALRDETNASPRVVVAGLAAGVPTIGDLEHVLDRTPGLGPLGGLDAVMHALRDDADHLLVAPCDMPMLTATTLRSLLVPTEADATLFQGRDGAPTPLPMRIALTAAPVVKHRLHGSDRSLRGLIAECTTEAIECIVPEQLRSINTPEDLETWIGRREQR